MKFLLILLVIVGAIWFFFLRPKSRLGNGANNGAGFGAKFGSDSGLDSQNLPGVEMLQCKVCGTFSSQSEGVKAGGNFFCSKECFDKFSQ